MNPAARRLTAWIVGAVLSVGLAIVASLFWASPRILLIEPELAQQTVARDVMVGVPTVVVVCCIVWARMHAHRHTLRSLGRGAHSIKPKALISLGREPGAVTDRFFMASVVGAGLTTLPVVRPDGLPLDTAISIALLILTFSTTASLALYVFARRKVSRVMRLAPEDAMREAVERVRRSGRSVIWTRLRVVATILVPTVLIGVVTACIVDAQLRAFGASGRIETAACLARSVLEPVPNAATTNHASCVASEGDDDAAVCVAHGYAVHLHSDPASFDVHHDGTGQIDVTIPLDEGHAKVGFRRKAFTAAAAPAALVAILAGLISAIVGIALGRSLSADIDQATVQVHALGTDTVLLGVSQVGRPARFASVVTLGKAVEMLADRFRVFASAHQRAISAIHATRRMRNLLFASVSHDLKGSLHSILGFADIIDTRSMNAQQTESLQVIKTRGRELQWLIQTILDGARIEEGGVVLDNREVVVGDLLRDAVERVREAVGMEAVPIVNEVTCAAWRVYVDRDQMVRALQSLLHHAIRTAGAGVVELRAVVSPCEGNVLVDISIPSRAVPAAKLARLLSSDGEATMPRDAGGLALGLMVGRSLVVLHGGDVEPWDTETGVVLRVVLPLSGGGEVRVGGVG